MLAALFPFSLATAASVASLSIYWGVPLYNAFHADYSIFIFFGPCSFRSQFVKMLRMMHDEYLPELALSKEGDEQVMWHCAVCMVWLPCSSVLLGTGNFKLAQHSLRAWLPVHITWWFYPRLTWKPMRPQVLVTPKKASILLPQQHFVRSLSPCSLLLLFFQGCYFDVNISSRKRCVNCS